MLRTEPEKLCRVLHDLYVLLPILQEHSSADSVAKHIEIIEYYKQQHDKAVDHWNFPKKAA